MKRIAIYPGSFDPITNGHLDIINRASKLFDEVIILVAYNKEKKARFSAEDRVSMIKESISKFKNVSVDSYSGLTMEYAKNKGAKGVKIAATALTAAVATGFAVKELYDIITKSNSER